MMKAPTANSRRQSVDRHGISVTLTNYTQGTPDLTVSSDTTLSVGLTEKDTVTIESGNTLTVPDDALLRATNIITNGTLEIKSGGEVEQANFDTQESDYGERYNNNPTTHTITARPWTSTRAESNRDSKQAGEIEADRLFIVKDNETGVSNITDGGGEGASEITENGTKYYVSRVRENNDGTKTIEAVLD